MEPDKRSCGWCNELHRDLGFVVPCFLGFSKEKERGEREEKDATGEAVGWKQAVTCMCMCERERD